MARRPARVPRKSMPPVALAVLDYIEQSDQPTVELIAMELELHQNDALSWCMWLADRGYVCSTWVSDGRASAQRWHDDRPDGWPNGAHHKTAADVAHAAAVERRCGPCGPSSVPEGWHAA